MAQRAAAACAHRIRQSECRVLVAGDVMLDRYVWGTVRRISPEAPVPVLEVGSESRRVGGAANVAANALALGARAVFLAGVCSDDPQARTLVAELGDAGVDTSALVVDRGRPTTEKTRIMAGRQQIVRLDQETREPIRAGVRDALLARCSELLRSCNVVIVSDYGKGVCTPEVVETICQLARSCGVPVLCDPKGQNYVKYRGSTMITPNRREAGDAVGRTLDTLGEVESAARRLRDDLRLDHVLVTLGEDGMLLLDENQVTHIPAVARDVFDVTGAGDTVIAALAVATAAGSPMTEACAFATVAAGLSVARVGNAVITLSELELEISTANAEGARSSDKIVSAEEAARAVAEHVKRGHRVVFTNGCFDVLHRGHVTYLEAARGFGQTLVVGLNTDDSVKRLKGPLRPVNNELDRAHVLAALSAVDFVVLFPEDTPERLIQQLGPDVLVKGDDYAVADIVGGDFVRARGGEVRTVALVEGRSTSATIAKIRAATRER